MPNHDSAASLNRPAVTVIIPAYRAAKVVGMALDSVFHQTQNEGGMQVIVVNDGSPDSDDLVEAIKPHAGQIRYIVQDNEGPGSARNTGIREADGAFIAFLDADDYWPPDYLARQLQFFEDNPVADMICADGLIVGDSALAGTRLMDMRPPAGEINFESLLMGLCTIVLSGVV